jgi:hypothetical protein
VRIALVLLQVRYPAGGQVVENHHVVAVVQKAVDDVAADEAGPARNDGFARLRRHEWFLLLL